MDTILGILAQVAPAIVKTLIPGGPLIDLGFKALVEVLGLPKNATENDVVEKVKNATPEEFLKIREADNKFKMDMKKAGIDIEKIHAKDRDSARIMQKTARSIAPGMIALVSFLGFFSILGIMIFHKIPNDSMQPVMLLLGVLGGIVVQVTNFYFGSSKNSQGNGKVTK